MTKLITLLLSFLFVFTAFSKDIRSRVYRSVPVLVSFRDFEFDLEACKRNLKGDKDEEQISCTMIDKSIDISKDLHIFPLFTGRIEVEKGKYILDIIPLVNGVSAHLNRNDFQPLAIEEARKALDIFKGHPKLSKAISANVLVTE